MNDQGFGFIDLMVDQILEAMAGEPEQLKKVYERLSSSDFSRLFFRAALKGQITRLNWNEDIQAGIKRNDIDKVVGLVADGMQAKLAERLTPPTPSIEQAHADREAIGMASQMA